MVDFTREKDSDKVDFSDWGFGEITLKPFLAKIMKQAGLAVEEQFKTDPPTASLVISYSDQHVEDPTTIRLELCALGNNDGGPSFHLNFSSIIDDFIESHEVDGMIRHPSRAKELVERLRALADHVEKRIL